MSKSHNKPNYLSSYFNIKHINILNLVYKKSSYQKVDDNTFMPV
jgi:hypothetical protein